jgi:hypothetical protein
VRTRKANSTGFFNRLLTTLISLGIFGALIFFFWIKPMKDENSKLEVQKMEEVAEMMEKKNTSFAQDLQWVDLELVRLDKVIGIIEGNNYTRSLADSAELIIFPLPTSGPTWMGGSEFITKEWASFYAENCNMNESTLENKRGLFSTDFRKEAVVLKVSLETFKKRLLARKEAI